MFDRKRSAGLRRAHALHERFRARGEFTTEAFEAALREELVEFQGEAFDGYVQHIADIVDKQFIRPDTSDQPFLLGMSWDIEGGIRLGEGRRIAKSLALIEHLDEMLVNVEENAAAVLIASARKHKEVALLRPYMRQGVTKAAAIALYEADHPSSRESTG